ncbi:MAG: Flp family type IVb pilin [Stenotrophobium sp.]
MMQELMKFIRDEEGATAIEYGLIIGLIAVAIVAVLILVGSNLNSLFTTVDNKLSAAAG